MTWIDPYTCIRPNTLHLGLDRLYKELILWDIKLQKAALSKAVLNAYDSDTIAKIFNS